MSSNELAEVRRVLGVVRENYAGSEGRNKRLIERLRLSLDAQRATEIALERARGRERGLRFRIAELEALEVERLAELEQAAATVSWALSGGSSGQPAITTPGSIADALRVCTDKGGAQ